MLEPRPEMRMAVRAFSLMSAAKPAMPDDARTALGPRNDGAENGNLFAKFLQIPADLGCRGLRHDCDHAGAAVEGSQEFGGLGFPRLLEPGEHLRKGQGGKIDLDAHIHRQHARYVFNEAAACNRSKGLDGCLAPEHL